MKWRYVLFTEDYEAYGTNDLEAAREAIDWCQVYDAETGAWLRQDDDRPGFLREIKEWGEAE